MLQQFTQNGLKRESREKQVMKHTMVKLGSVNCFWRESLKIESLPAVEETLTTLPLSLINGNNAKVASNVP